MLGAPDNSVEIAEAVTSMFTGNGAGVDGFSPNYGKDPITTTCKQGAWDLTLAPALRVTANSDVVSLYV